MIVDASALLAVVLNEPDGRRFAGAPHARMPALPDLTRIWRDIRRSDAYFYHDHRNFYRGLPWAHN